MLALHATNWRSCTSPGLPNPFTVPVKKGTPYLACGTGGSDSEVCEPGAFASLGSDNITDQIWSCPPESCITNPESCSSGHR